MSTLDELFQALIKGDRYALSKSITLVESDRPADREQGLFLLDKCEKLKPQYFSMAITGSPGVGKSTFIEAIGLRFLEQGHRLAVLAVDPASQISAGTILGDKTRMEKLSHSERVFIRPSSNRQNYGGLTPTTWETMLLCAAAGYDHILIETVGVGQNEIAAAFVADLVILLMLPGAGDELQGIKRGILEIAHLLLINKDDGVQGELVKQTLNTWKQNLQHVGSWKQKIMPISALEDKGLEPVLSMVQTFRKSHVASLHNVHKTRWLRARIDDVLLRAARKKEQENIENLISRMQDSEITAAGALSDFRKRLLT